MLICFAVIHEAKPLLRLLRDPPSTQCVITGMGRRNAEANFLKSVSVRKPGFVITSGFAGGLDPTLAAGEIVYSADPNFPLQSRFCEAGARLGTFHCAERIAVTPLEKRKLREETGADAVEMESGWIRAICLNEGIPSATIRVISDSAEEELPLDFNGFMTADCRLNYLKLAGVLAVRPRLWKRLFQFQKQTSAAARRLGAALFNLVPG